jgi:hypothetical protein
MGAIHSSNRRLHTRDGLVSRRQRRGSVWLHGSCEAASSRGRAPCGAASSRGPFPGPIEPPDEQNGRAAPRRGRSPLASMSGVAWSDSLCLPAFPARETAPTRRPRRRGRRGRSSSRCTLRSTSIRRRSSVRLRDRRTRRGARAHPAAVPQDPRPLLVTNPAHDREFAAAAESLLDEGILQIEDFRTRLRVGYPAVAVNLRELSSEPLIVWYVYRDGRWTAEQADTPPSPTYDLRATEQALQRDARVVAELEARKARLPRDAGVEQIPGKVRHLARQLSAKAIAEQELVAGIQAPRNRRRHN